MIKVSRKVLCVDWDRRALRLVVARIGGGRMVLEDAHSHRLPNTVDVESPQSLGEFIRQTLRRHHWHHRSVIVDIPRDKAVINRLTLPPTPASEVAAAVRFQAMKELPFPLDSAVIDYEILKRDEQEQATEVLLAAVPMEALSAVQATCEAAGLTPARIGLRPYANLTSLKQLPDLADQRVLFVDVGPSMTEIDVIVAGQLGFARAANVNVPMTRDVALEDSRITTLADVADLESADEAIEVAVRELTVEITRTIQAYRATEPDVVIEQIVIAGGTGIEPELLEAAERRFGLSGRLFDPTVVLEARSDEAVKLRSFSATLGLAWGLGRGGALAIDFLNPKKPIPPRAALKRRMRVGVIAAGVLLAGALATDVTLYVRKSQELTAQKMVVSELRKELKEYLEIQNKVEEVRDWQYEAVWPEHLLLLTENAIEPGESMLVQQMSFDSRSALIKLQKVLATDMDVPADFVNQLNQLRRDGWLLYCATQGNWQTRSGQDSKFQGDTDISVQVLDLKKHLEEREKRVKARKKRLKKL